MQESTYAVYALNSYLGNFTAKQLGSRLAANKLNRNAMVLLDGKFVAMLSIDDVLSELNKARRKRHLVWMLVVVALFLGCSYVLRTPPP